MAIGAKLRYEVLRRDKYACRFCGATAEHAFLQVDHVVPRSAGGQDVMSNLQVLCTDCNAGKGQAMPERWLVREVKRKTASRSWLEPIADDLSEMYAYLDARFELEALTAEDVVALIMHVMADVFPYRPYGSELIIAAAKAAREHACGGVRA